MILRQSFDVLAQLLWLPSPYLLTALLSFKLSLNINKLFIILRPVSQMDHQKELTAIRKINFFLLQTSILIVVPEDSNAIHPLSLCEIMLLTKMINEKTHQVMVRFYWVFECLIWELNFFRDLTWIKTADAQNVRIHIFYVFFYFRTTILPLKLLVKRGSIFFRICLQLS